MEGLKKTKQLTETQRKVLAFMQEQQKGKTFEHFHAIRLLGWDNLPYRDVKQRTRLPFYKMMEGLRKMGYVGREVHYTFGKWHIGAGYELKEAGKQLKLNLKYYDKK